MTGLFVKYVLPILAVIGICYGAYTYVNRLHAEVLTLTTDIASIKLESDSLRSSFKDLEERVLTSEKRSRILNNQLTKARIEAEKARKVLTDHNLQMLLDAKPDLVIKKMNKATDRVFKDLEEATQ